MFLWLYMAQLIQFFLSHRSDIVPLWNSLFFSTGRILRLFTQTNTKMYFKLFLKFVYSIKNEFKCKLEQINYLFLFHEIIKTKLKNIYALFSFFIIMQYRIRRIFARVNLAFYSKNWILMIKLNLMFYDHIINYIMFKRHVFLYLRVSLTMPL